MSHTRFGALAAIVTTLALNGCSWDWDRLEPRTTPIVTDTGVDALDPDAVAMDVAVDTAPVDGGCAPGMTSCGGRCVNLTMDTEHCGGCEVRCPNTTCQSGVCTATCVLGNLDCNNNVADGCEANALTSNQHCGGCNTACMGAGRSCTNGMCACLGTNADCDMMPANGCEVNLNVDMNNCGACGTRCRMGQSCVAGSCVCPGGTADCDMMAANGCEVDIQNSETNCGGCGRACGDGASCVAGVCQCASGLQRCPTTALCATAVLDPMNCGGCGTVCAGATGLCSARGCVAECGAGETRCERACVNTATDARNCGMCGRACGAHQRCDGAATPGCACEPGFADCDMNPANGCEANLATAGTCGRCDNACGAGRICREGACQCTGGLRACSDGRCAACCGDTDCDDGMACTTDRCVTGVCQSTACAHCCSVSGAMVCRECCTSADCAGGRACGADGACMGCAAGRGDCDNLTENGCETDITTLANCGGCRMACSPANATGMCAMGRCAIASCNAGFADCDSNPANGCEVDTRVSAMNCGRCGNVCVSAGGSVSCVAGTCRATTCDPGRGNCDGLDTNGCEATLATDARNCGGCGTICVTPRATPVCAAGLCSVGACDSGFGDCDRSVANGCEASTQSDAANCGTCGNRCVFDNAVGRCLSGTCSVGSCNSGFGNCDAMAANGCETNVLTSALHCGGCGVACATRPNSRPSCALGSCGITCSDGFADCDGIALNGCEVNLLSDVGNCGVCARACATANGVGQCSSGVCAIRSCNAGFENCDGVVSNGCETDLQSDLSNCGACRASCAPPNAVGACRSGVCSITMCTGLFSNCDASVTNGCESNIATASAHCGHCGVACGSGRTCTNGACQRPVTVTYTVSSPAITWVDACAATGSRRVLSSQDDALVYLTVFDAAFPPPGSADPTLPFPFEFFGGMTSSLLISTNGYFLVGDIGRNQIAVNAGASYGLLPGAGSPAPAIFAFGRDLVTRAEGICYATLGTAPNRRFVAETLNAAFYDSADLSRMSGNLSFEMILNEGTNVIEMLYDTPWNVSSVCVAGTSCLAGGPTARNEVTVGVQNLAGSVAFSFTGNVSSGTRVRFTPSP